MKRVNNCFQRYECAETRSNASETCLTSRTTMFQEGGDNMQNYVSKEVVCPFYKQEEATKIRCEGYCKTTSLQTSFAKKELLALHKERHCNSFKGYPKCPLYEVICKQYESKA